MLLMKAEMADKNNSNRISTLWPTLWCSLHPRGPSFVSFLGWGFWMFLNTYVHTHQVLSSISFFCCCCSHQPPNCVPIKFPMCSHFAPMTFVQALNSHIICVCVCVCVWAQGSTSINSYFECKLLFWRVSKVSRFPFMMGKSKWLTRYYFFFKFKRGKLTNNFGMHLTTIP
jgi:hypothetical protein